MTGAKFKYNGVEYIKIHGTHVQTDNETPICLAVRADSEGFPKEAFLVPFVLGMPTNTDPLN